MKSYLKAMQELRHAMRSTSPLQLAIALEAVAFIHVEMYLDHNPPPDCTPEELEELRAAMIYSSIAGALNTAAEVALDISAKPARQPDPDAEAVAKAMAEAAIAKAKGGLQ